MRTRVISKPRRLRLAALAGCFVLLAMSMNSCAVVDQGNFSLLTYNVAGLPQEVSTENPQVNIPQISPKLNPYDIVVTQEDFDWWAPELNQLDFVNYHNRLRAQATHPHRSGQHPGPGAVGIDGSDPERPMPFVGDGLGYLSRFPIANVQRVPWEHCFGGADTNDGGSGDCLAMKGFSVATVTLAQSILVDVYTLHAEAGGTELDDRMIAEDFVQLSEYMSGYSEGRAVIVAGDTNLHLEPGHPSTPHARPIWERFLYQQELTDVCSVVSCESPGAIDKVAFRSDGSVDLEPLEWRWEDDIFVDSAGDDLSDHPPVAVDWHWSRHK